jgi:prepilin-type N-terminal cleavage/methylation domain-containing protein
MISMKQTSKGFTLTEMLIALLIFSIINALAVSFFIYQSKTGAGISRERVARESVGMALLLMTRDVMHGGYSLPMDPQLGLFVGGDNSDGAYHELYVNYGRYLKPEPVAPSPSVFDAKAMTQANVSSGTTFQIQNGSEIEAKGTVKNVARAIVLLNPDSLSPTVQYPPPSVTGSTASGSAVSTFTFDSAPSGLYKFAPALSYTFTKPTSAAPHGAILRNNESLVGGTLSLSIEDFRIRCLFSDTDGVTQRWSPDYKTFDQLPPRNLRYLEITIIYKTFDPYYEGRTERTNVVTRVMRVSPRTTVLAAYD